MPNATLDVEALRKEITCDMFTEDAPGYDEARQMHDPTIDYRPGVIVRVKSAEDVAAVVRAAARAGVPVAARSGGHGLSDDMLVDVAVTVDLSLMKAVNIDPENGTARVQPGTTSGDLAGPANAHGLALSTGDTASVGMGGLVTGGGIGFMVRKFGLAIDNLIGAQIVTADGEIRTCNENENPDLFWGIRGGGGNFGIVTEFEFRMAHVNEILGGAIVFPATREVVRGYADYAPDAPEDLTTISALTKAPPAPFIPPEWVGKPIFMVLVCWTGSVEDGQKALEPIRKLATPVAEVIAPMPYPGIYNLTAEASARHGNSIRSIVQRSISDESIGKMVAHIEHGSAMMNMIQIRGLGGAFARVHPEATAFSDRDARYITSIIAVWGDPAEDASGHRDWIVQLYDQCSHEASGVYVNFLETEGEERIKECYGENYPRMLELKRKYDPNNMFRYNQNIKP